jgi:hypothetical protein
MTRLLLHDAADSIVINTGPLISLGRASAFHIIGQLPLLFLIPQEVAHEITAKIREMNLNGVRGGNEDYIVVSDVMKQSGFQKNDHNNSH